MENIIGYIKTYNTNENYYNLVVEDEFETLHNIKATKEQFNELVVNHIYKFIVEERMTKRLAFFLVEAIDVSKIQDKERDTILRRFLPHKDKNYDDRNEMLLSYIKRIKNSNLRKITESLYNANMVDFLTSIGGMRIHHAYLGGLAEHTIGMLQLADAFLGIYKFLESDYVYAGIILHDLGKIKEYSDIQSPEFTLDGQLLGHLVLGAMSVHNEAIKLGCENTEEVKILEHILISHHGKLEFGSAKKPLTAEALLVWQIDSLDSKFSVLSDVLTNTNCGTFTESLPVLERQRLYKPNELNK